MVSKSIAYRKDEVTNEEKIAKDSVDSKVNVKSSWFHRQSSKKRSKSMYDFYCRNPLHAGAEFASVWELLLLRRCFHPSVSLFAHQLSNSKEIKYSGDPLLDFTTSRFLDRFVYRNPKKQSESLEQNVHTRVFGGRKLKAKTSKLLPINSNEYIQQNSQNIPTEEQFIYQYLQKRAASVKRKKDDSDIESVTSEDFQKLLDNISLYQAPNLQCGILILLSEVSKIHPSILAMKQSFESDGESEEHYEDAP